MSNVSLQIRQAVPAIDSVVADYAVGYIQHVSDATEDSVRAQRINISDEMAFLNSLSCPFSKLSFFCSSVEYHRFTAR